jgi:type VI secretion system protein
MFGNFRSSFFLLLFTVLFGCKTGSPLFQEEDWEFIDELTLVAAPNMNNKSPLKVDVVIVKDARIAEQVARLTARQYMKQRKQLKYDHPQSIKIKSFELIPGTSIITPLKYQKSEVAAGFVFANYNNQKPNRWNVFSSDCVKVELLESTVRITSHKWKEAPKAQEHSRQNDGVIVLS